MIWKRASIENQESRIKNQESRIKSFSLFAQPQASWADTWKVIVPLLQSGAIKPIVAKTFALAKAAAALRYLVEDRASAESSSQSDKLKSDEVTFAGKKTVAGD